MTQDHSWQLSNLELSKRLKELGVKQESLWWWGQLVTGNKTPFKLYLKGQNPSYNYFKLYSAFTWAELFKLHYEANGRYPKAIMETKPEDMANVLAELLIHKKSKK